MSQQDQEIERLHSEIAALRAGLRALSLRVDNQEDRLEEVRSSVAGSVAGDQSVVSAVSSPLQVPASSGSYSFVTSAPSAPFVPSEPTASDDQWSFRDSVAREIGQFLRRAVDRQHRGNSGREKLGKIPSQFYIIVRDFRGCEYRDPVRIVRNFREVANLCKRGSDCGDSVFVGVPTLREAEIAVKSGGLGWPETIQ